MHRSLCPAWVKLDEASSARRKPYYDTYPNTTDGDNHFCRVDQDLSTFFDGMIDKDSVGVVSRQFAHEEPRCLCCYGIEGPDRRLEHCPDCMLFAWCKEGSCKWKCKNAHVWDGVCDQYRRIANMEDAVLCAELDSRNWRPADTLCSSEHENDPATKSEIEHWVPSRVRSTYKKLPSSWEAYLKRLDPPRPADHPITPAMVHLTLSIPLTILMCLERFGIAPSFADAKNRKVLTIHMVGASSGYENTAVSHTMEEVRWGARSTARREKSPLSSTSFSFRSSTSCPACASSTSFTLDQKSTRAIQVALCLSSFASLACRMGALVRSGTRRARALPGQTTHLPDH